MINRMINGMNGLSLRSGKPSVKTVQRQGREQLIHTRVEWARKKPWLPPSHDDGSSANTKVVVSDSICWITKTTLEQTTRHWLTGENQEMELDQQRGLRRAVFRPPVYPQLVVNGTEETWRTLLFSGGSVLTVSDSETQNQKERSERRTHLMMKDGTIDGMNWLSLTGGRPSVRTA